MALVYILYSVELKRYYTGMTTLALSDRLDHHLNDYYSNKYTHKAKDWKLYLEIVCDSTVQASQIERHIKLMKSSKYIENLKKYPEMIEALMRRYGS